MTRATTWQGIATCLLVFTASACSVFEPPLTGTDRDGGADVDGGTNDAGNTGTDSGTSIDNCPGPIVINEVDGATTGSGSDREFVEIFNASNENQSVGGLNLASQRGSGPDVGKARTIPDGFILPPSGFLYVMANVSTAEPGLQTSGCIDAAPTPCLQVTWDIDANGASLYILNRENTQILCEFGYPRNVIAGDAWGRLPDGSATLSSTRPSPGGPNRAP